MLKKILKSKTSSITTAAVIIAAAGLLSRLLGVVRDRILASQFGAGNELDVYFAAFRVPDLVYNLIVLGALSAGFIPIFIQLLKDDEKYSFDVNKAAWNLVNNLLNITSIFLIGFGIILAVFSSWIVPLITPGFEGEKLQMTINLTRLMFLSPVLLGISGIISGVLQSFKRFLVYAIAPVMYNLGIIFGAVFLTKYWGIYGLAGGVIIGAALHLLIQIPTAISLGWRYKPILHLRDSSFVKLIKMMGPRVLALASTQLNLIVITILASTLTMGSLAIFTLANNLQSFPLGIFGVSFAIAAFPALSKSFAKKEHDDFVGIFSKTFKQIMFFIIPFSILFIILRIQIVRVVLGAGKFDWEATKLTADALGVFSISLFAQALIPLLARAFYARHNTIIPFVASFVGVAVNLVLSFFLIQKIGVIGLAFGFSISSIVTFSLMIVFLKVKIKKLGHKGLIKSLAKISFASLVMGVVAQYVKTGMGMVVDMERFWGVLLQGAVAGVVGLIVFAVIGYLLKTEELLIFLASLKRKLFKKVKVEKEGISEAS